MAEVLTGHIYPGQFYSASAGVTAGERDPFVDAVLAEVGAGLGSFRPRALDDLDDLAFDLAVTLSPEAHHRLLDMTRTAAMEVEYWPTPDPTLATGSREQILAAYRDLRERLAVRIRDRFGRQQPVPSCDTMR